MTESADLAVDRGTRPFDLRAWTSANALWLGVGLTTAVAGAFLLHQQMAWPPHEDETLALFVGRDTLVGVVEHVTRERGGAPLHFLVAWAVAHLGFGLGGLRTMSTVFALASLPLVALLGVRLVGRRAALIGTVLFAASWLFLFHGIYARMYSLFLILSLVTTLALLRALDRGGTSAWLLWIGSALLLLAAHPYAVLVLGAQGLFVLLARRDRIREALVAGLVLLIAGIPFWITDLVLAERFEVGVGGGGAKLGGPSAVAEYLWRAAGDATSGWWPLTLLVLALATAGLVRMRAEARILALCLVAVPAVAFLAARMGGAAAPESRHLIFAAPVLSLAAAAGLTWLTRRTPPLLAVAVAGLVLAELAWAWHRTPPLFEWEPDQRQAARAEAERWLAETGRHDDVLFGYEPLYLGAWERRSDVSRTVVPRADPRLALRTLRREAPLGRGVWVLDASERNNLKPRLEIEDRVPTPAGAFDARAFGPFLVIRTTEPIGSPARYLELATRAILVGRTLGIGDADVNLRTVELAAREERGYGPSLRLRSADSR